MNYYAQGGQAYGLKSLAQELPKYGRYGDDVVAHISSDEARMLKAMGGSGTINPQTGLPEFFKIRNPFKPIQKAIGQLNPLNPGSSLSKTINTTPVVGDINKALNKVGTQIFQPVEKAIVQPVSAGLASFDKAVGKTIPGGWGTVGQIALSAMGAPVPLQVAYGAARGSGVMRKGGNFNLQGAMIGGATAYATAQLGEYMRGAVPGTEVAPTVDAAGNLVNPVPELLNTAEPLTQLGNIAPPPPIVPNLDPGYLDVNPGLPSVFNPPPPPSFLSNIATKAGDAMSGTAKFVTEAPTTGVAEAAKTGQGAMNLLGIGEGTAKAAAANAATTGIKALPMAGMALYGETSLSALDDQRKYLEESKQANAINQAEYDSALAEINRQRDYADKIVRENPINPDPNRDVSIGDTLYGRMDADRNLYDRAIDPRSTLYAMGGSVDDEAGIDEARGLGLGNLSNGFMNMGSTPAYDKGGKVSTSNIDKERRDYLDMLNAEFMLPPSQYVEGMGFMSPPQSVGGRLGANLDALGGNLRAGLSGTAMRDQEGNIRTMPGMLDVGYKGQVGPGELDVGLQRAIRAMPGRNKDYALNAKYSVKFAEGGQPRFLSGGGDGMSDDIPATINGRQPARLADGEFVVPADVVSHIGNGSSKAGAKQLYSMMNKVRKARTGNPKQGKQINPRKYLPA